jgi:hypothetical protein
MSKNPGKSGIGQKKKQPGKSSKRKVMGREGLTVEKMRHGWV